MPANTPTSPLAAGLLDIESLDRSEIQAILDRARFFQPPPNETYRRLDSLRGKTIVNLFFEASTRTRVSFEIAAKRLGADTISIAAQQSSVSKGESLVDTLNTLVAMRPNAGCDAPRSFRRAPFSGAASADSHRECGRWHARTSHPGPAGRPHHSRSPQVARKSPSGNHRRYRAQPSGALRYSFALQIRRGNRALRTAVSGPVRTERNLRPESASPTT